MGLRFSTLAKYKGMFKKCYVEPCVHGWAVYDRSNNHIGRILDQGFALDVNYEHSDKVNVELTKRGITVFDVDLHDEIKLQEILDTLQNE